MSLARFAWGFAAYLILVILFGAWVRITGSGAGCGNHWPMCQGVVLPPDPSSKTLIELGHRLTSGLSGVMGLALLVWSRRTPAFRWALASFVFLLLEGFIGAVLVKKELVAGDASLSRAVVISLHLMNTLALMLCAVATAVKAESTPAERSAGHRNLLLAVMAMVVLTSMTGAITALGDTLFPQSPAMGPELIAKLADDLRPSQHFLVRLRIIHPVVAAVTAMLMLGLFALIQRSSRNRWAAAGLALTGIQVLLGLANIALAAPGWMQITHLLAAQLLWVVLVRLLFLFPHHLGVVHLEKVLDAEGARHAVGQ